MAESDTSRHANLRNLSPPGKPGSQRSLLRLLAISREPLLQDPPRLTLSASLNLPDLAVASKKWPFFPQGYQSHAWVPSGIGLVCYFLASFIHQAPLLNAPETEATGRREVNVPSEGSQKQGWTSRNSQWFSNIFLTSHSLFQKIYLQIRKV